MKANKLSRNSSLREWLFYAVMLAFFILAFWGIASLGPNESYHTELNTASSAFKGFSLTVEEHFSSTIGRLLMQIIVILTVARSMGWLLNKINQPTVIGEIIAGIMLGPSLLGAIWPEAFELIFPESSLGNIKLLSHFGLILFMFAIGMELNMSDIKQSLRKSLIISHAGIAIPFVLGMLGGLATYSSYASGHTSFLPYILFLGISMCITAFPVLARIIQERRMGQTHLGALSLSAAAASDITAWLMLAAVMAIAQSGSMKSSLFNLLFLIVYLLICFGILRPLFKMLGKIFNNQEILSKTMVSFIFVLLLLSSFVTELLSMHALFGAFMLGLIMPENVKFRKIMTEKVEDVSLSLFLPLFFVSTGLQTHLGLLNTPELWWLTIGFTVIAIVGKVGGTYMAARVCGEGKKDSLYLGAFMNTRGLMELVVLAIGQEMGILPPLIFTILVMMTIITTFMTTPLIHFIGLVFRFEKKKAHENELLINKENVLISFGRASTGARLLRAADLLTRRYDYQPQVTALHLTVGQDVNQMDAEVYEQRSFGPVIEESKRLDVKLRTKYFAVQDKPEAEIVHFFNQGGYRMLLVGAGINLSNRKSDREAMQARSKLKRKLGPMGIATPKAISQAFDLLRDKMHYFVSETEKSVAVLVDRGFSDVKSVLLLVERKEDANLLDYARAIATNKHAELEIKSPSTQVEIAVASDEQINYSPVNKELLAKYDFLVLSYNYWQTFAQEQKESLSLIPSTLIIHHRD